MKHKDCIKEVWLMTDSRAVYAYDKNGDCVLSGPFTLLREIVLENSPAPCDFYMVSLGDYKKVITRMVFSCACRDEVLR